MSGRKLACIIGWPVAQSLSPAIHNAAFAACGLDWTYVSIAVRPGSVEEGIGLLRTLGVEGANVTMPHKRDVIPFLDEIADTAAAVGAVNTIARDRNRLIGHNTDGDGFLRWLRCEGFDPAGKRALILGAGGAARAVALALARAGAEVRVCARRTGQAAEVAALDAAIAAADWGEPGEADLVVQSTPARDGLPLERLSFGPAVIAVDLIYPPPPTRFVEAARAAAARAFDGLGMLVQQAALSFELWTGRAAPLDVMDVAARAALAPD